MLTGLLADRCVRADPSRRCQWSWGARWPQVWGCPMWRNQPRLLNTPLHGTHSPIVIEYYMAHGKENFSKESTSTLWYVRSAEESKGLCCRVTFNQVVGRMIPMIKEPGVDTYGNTCTVCAHRLSLNSTEKDRWWRRVRLWLTFPSPTPRMRSQVRWAVEILSMADSRLLSNWMMSLSRYCR